MDIKTRNFKYNCPYCKDQIVLTFNTLKCPKCGHAYDPDVVHNYYYEVESKLVNSKEYQRAQRLMKTGENITSVSNGASQFGCAAIVFPAFVVLILIIIFML